MKRQEKSNTSPTTKPATKSTNPKTTISHQFNAFPFDEVRPRMNMKGVLDEKAVRAGKKAFDAGNMDKAAKQMKRVREGLENFERSMWMRK